MDSGDLLDEQFELLMFLVEENLFDEIDVSLKISLSGDSSASQGTLQRLGAGRMKHLSTRQLWLQERVYTGEVAVHKIPRVKNWADVLTHAWSTADAYHFNTMGVQKASV